MSSSITLSAATRQNLLSLQDTASLLATTQSRLSTGKKVNSALDNPINFFTATNLSARSTELSSLLDGISNGVQTIQAANTGLSKLQSLTSQLKSTAQQALAATNAFTSKAATVSTALSGASATNLLSTGPTAAVSDKAVGTLMDGKPAAAVAATVTGSVDYKPTAAPSTMRGARFTATTPTAAKATAASAFSAPGNAVAGTVTGGRAFGLSGDATLTIKAGTGSTERTITVDLAQNMTADQAVEAIKTKINTFNADPANRDNRSTVAVSLDRDGKLAFTGDTNGDQIRVTASGTGAAGTGFGTTATVSTDNVAAQTQKLTIGTREITISGGRAGDDAADVRKAVLQAINEANTGATPTGVTATFESDGGTGQRLVLSGKADGTNFTVTGSPGNTLGFGSTALTTANGAPAATQTLTINGTQVTIPGGGDIDAAVTAINNQKGTTGVSAAKDPADATRLLLTGKADGSAFTVASSNPVSSGFSATPTTTSLAATVSGVFTPDGTPATTTASGAFQAPAGAVAGTLTAAYSPPAAGGTRLTVTSGAGGNGNTFTVDLAAGDSKETAARKFNDAFKAGNSDIKAAVSGSNLVFTGKSNGDALSITSGVALAGFTSPVSAVNAQQAQSGTVLGNTYAAPGAGGAKLTIKSGTDSPITVELAQDDAIGTALGKIQAGLGPNSGISVALNADGTKLVFTGKADGSALNVSSTGPGAGFTAASTSSNATASTKGSIEGSNYVAPGAGGVRLAISDTANGTPISVDLAAGDSIDAAVTAISTALTDKGSSITVAKNAAGTALVFTASADNANVTVSPASAAGGFVNAGQASSGERTAVRGTLSATAPYAAPAAGSGGAKLTITSGTGATATTYSVDLTSTETSATLAAAKIQAKLDENGTSGITVSGSTGTLVFTGKADGSALNVASTGPGGGFTATPSLSTDQKAADSQTITIRGATGGDQQITISGGAAGDSADKVLAGALAAINDKSGTTGVTASASSDGKIVLKGAATGAGFTVTGGPNSTAGFGTSPVTVNNGKASEPQTLTINGTAITIGASKLPAEAAGLIDAQKAITGVGAIFDEATGTIKLTGKADGSAFTVQSSNAASSGFSGITQRVTNNQGAAQTVTVNGTDIAIAASATLDEAIAAINAKSSITGVTAGKDQAGTKLTFTGGADGNSFTIKGSEYNALGLASTEASVAGISDPGQTSLISALGFKGGDSFSVNGQTVNLTATDTIGSLVQKVGAATNGAVTASYDAINNKFSFTAADSRTAVQLGDGSTATSKVSNLGFTATDFAAGAGQPTSQSALAGKSLTVQVGSGTAMTTATVTFGTAPGQVSTLAQLNEALAPANAQATIDSLTGKISITTSNDVGAQNLSIVANGTGNPFTTGTASANLGGDGLNARNNLVQTYNDLLKQMDQLASDAGFNGVNLLSGDNLTINFNEKGTSQLKVQGSATSAASLGLSAVGQTNFQESSAIKKIVDQINSASSQLQSRAAALGSNLAVVQNRQDFTKQIINVLDTGAANLTSADLNEEAANSQALSTRNSLAISALSLANQSQQGILQLLR
ncbi:flagellin hook IN motif-containing protein [Methylorubrum thiocyanatum]|uniref:flagellin hook IN motif-containing protein n=1 Tax=Methylorubrum thiocyanatum TaxID=47958 RepID=UPI00383A1A32